MAKKSLTEGIQDVVVSIHKSVNNIKKNEKVKKVVQNTSNAFETLGKQLEKDFSNLTSKK